MWQRFNNGGLLGLNICTVPNCCSTFSTCVLIQLHYIWSFLNSNPPRVSLVHKHICHSDILFLSPMNFGTLLYQMIGFIMKHELLSCALVCVPIAICIVIGPVLLSMNANLPALPLPLPLSLSHCVVFSYFLFSRRACPSQTFPLRAAHSVSDPYLQFPPIATLWANLHHTTYHQREREIRGETEARRDGEKEVE